MALPKDLAEYRNWLDSEIRRLGALADTIVIQLEQLRLARFHLPEPEPVKTTEPKPPRKRTRPTKEKNANLCGKDGPEYYGPCVLPKGHEEPHEFELWRRTPGKDFACWDYRDDGGSSFRCVAEKGHEGEHVWKPETIQEGDSTASTPGSGGPG